MSILKIPRNINQWVINHEDRKWLDFLLLLIAISLQFEIVNFCLYLASFGATHFVKDTIYIFIISTILAIGMVCVDVHRAKKNHTTKLFS